MSHHAIQMADGSVAIMQTVGDVTPEECLAKWHPAEQAKVVSHRPVSPDAIPQDRTFRDAWTDTGAEIVHDMDKARDIQRERLRTARAPRLAALDVELQRATTETPRRPTDGIVAEKQALRDATDDPRIDAAGTADELKALTLDAVVPSKTLTQVSEVVKD